MVSVHRRSLRSMPADTAHELDDASVIWDGGGGVAPHRSTHMGMLCPCSRAPPGLKAARRHTVGGRRWRWVWRTMYAREHPRLQAADPHGRRSGASYLRLLRLLQAAVLWDGGGRALHVNLLPAAAQLLECWWMAVARKGSGNCCCHEEVTTVRSIKRPRSLGGSSYFLRTCFPCPLQPC